MSIKFLVLGGGGYFGVGGGSADLILPSDTKLL